MNHEQLAAAVAAKASVTQSVANAILTAILEIIMETVAEGGKVTLIGFGSFEPRDRKERIQRNPRTGEQMTILATRVPAFRAGKLFKKKIASSEFLNSLQTAFSKQQREQAVRVNRLRAAITTLEAQIHQIELSGSALPKGCYVSRYQARGGRGEVYWYYKLQASEAIFPTAQKQEKLSRYKHLGKAGSSAHVEAVMQGVRRSQIDELQRAIDSLKSSLLDVCLKDELEEQDQ